MSVVATVLDSTVGDVAGGTMPIQYNKYRLGREHSMMGVQRRGKPNLGWGGVPTGQGSISETALFTESWRLSRNWPGKEGHLSEGTTYEKAWRCGEFTMCLWTNKKGTGEGGPGVTARRREVHASSFLCCHRFSHLDFSKSKSKTRWYIGPHGVSTVKSLFFPL